LLQSPHTRSVATVISPDVATGRGDCLGCTFEHIPVKHSLGPKDRTLVLHGEHAVGCTFDAKGATQLLHPAAQGVEDSHDHNMDGECA
jgi:hypothetical protein